MNFKICLISLYSSSAIGLRYLASVLKKHGFEVSLVFFKEKDIALDLMQLPDKNDYDCLMKLMDDLNPDVVGLGVRSSFLSIATEITQKIQQEQSRPVIWGGTHATVAPEQSIRIADMICLGEGEYAFLELAQALSAHGDPSTIQNLWIRKNGKIIKNPTRALFEDVDSLPYPDYLNENKFFVENGRVSAGDPGLNAFHMDILTSRGCPYQCTYCSNSQFQKLYKGKGRMVRQRSASNVLDEIRTQMPLFHKLKRIDFIDEVFSWDKAWVEAFVDQYKREIGLPFHCMQHPNTTDYKVMQMLKNAGLERVEIGIQTGSERVRKNIFKRPVTDKKLIQISKIMRDLNIVPFYDVIVDNPFETQADKKAGLALLLKMSRPFYMHMFSLIYFPNTVLTQKALAANLISEDQIEGNSTKTFHQMYVSLRHPRPSVDRFWISLYSLTSKRFVPKRLIKVLSRIQILQQHPAALISFAGLCNTIKLAFIAIKWLFEGKPVFSSLGKHSKSKKQGRRII